MFLTVHAAVGAVIGQEVNTSIVAFILGFISHFLLDVIPHGDDNLVKDYQNGEKIKIMLSIVLLDITTTIVFILAFLNINLSNPNITIIFWGILGSVLPDFIVGCYELFEIKLFKKFHAFHYFVHGGFKKFKIRFMPGLALQLVVLFLIFITF